MEGVEEQVSIGVGCRFNQLASTNGIKAEISLRLYNQQAFDVWPETDLIFAYPKSLICKFACFNWSLLPHLFFQKAELVIIQI